MTSLGFEGAALAASTLWAIGGLIIAGPTHLLGGPRMARVRMYWVAFALALIATVVGGWSSLDGGDVKRPA